MTKQRGCNKLAALFTGFLYLVPATGHALTEGNELFNLCTLPDTSLCLGYVKGAFESLAVSAPDALLKGSWLELVPRVAA